MLQALMHPMCSDLYEFIVYADNCNCVRIKPEKLYKFKVKKKHFWEVFLAIVFLNLKGFI